jgi:hypothetical protein
MLHPIPGIEAKMATLTFTFALEMTDILILKQLFAKGLPFKGFNSRSEINEDNSTLSEGYFISKR